MFESQTQVAFETPSSIVYERKLDTALRDTTRLAFFSRIKENKNNEFDDLLLGHLTIADLEKSSAVPNMFAYLYQAVVNDQSRGNRVGMKKDNWINRAIEIVKTVVLTQISWMKDKDTLPNVRAFHKKLDHYLSKLDIDQTMSGLCWIVHHISDLSQFIHRISAPKYYTLDKAERLKARLLVNTYEIETLKLLFIWSDKLVYIKLGTMTWLLPQPYVLLIHNKLCDILSVLFYAKTSDNNAVFNQGYNNTVHFLLHWAELSIKYKNKFFNIARTLEAICIGEILIKWMG